MQSDSPDQDSKAEDANRGQELQSSSADPPIDKTDFVVSPQTKAFQEQRTADLKRICNRLVEPQLGLRWGDMLNSLMRLIDDLREAEKDAQIKLDGTLTLIRLAMKTKEGD